MLVWLHWSCVTVFPMRQFERLQRAQCGAVQHCTPKGLVLHHDAHNHNMCSYTLAYFQQASQPHARCSICWLCAHRCDRKRSSGNAAWYNLSWQERAGNDSWWGRERQSVVCFRRFTTQTLYCRACLFVFMNSSNHLNPESDQSFLCKTPRSANFGPRTVHHRPKAKCVYSQIKLQSWPKRFKMCHLNHGRIALVNCLSFVEIIWNNFSTWHNASLLNMRWALIELFVACTVYAIVCALTCTTVMIIMMVWKWAVLPASFLVRCKESTFNGAHNPLVPCLPPTHSQHWLLVRWSRCSDWFATNVKQEGVGFAHNLGHFELSPVKGSWYNVIWLPYWSALHCLTR